MRGLFIALLMLVISGPAPATAQEKAAPPAEASPPLVMLKRYEASHPEKVLLAYYKVLGETPDYEDWARNSPFLRDAKPMDHDAIISRELNRLRRAFSDYNLDEMLVVHTEIVLDKYSTLQEKLEIAEFNPQTFFNYSLYGERVALIPKDIAQFGVMPMKKDKMDEMLGKAGSGAVNVEILLKPILADGEKPFEYKGRTYWLLMADIAEIRFWAKKENGPLLWLYRADWYTPKQDASLLKLKEGGGL